MRLNPDPEPVLGIELPGNLGPWLMAGCPTNGPGSGPAAPVCKPGPGQPPGWPRIWAPGCGGWLQMIVAHPLPGMNAGVPAGWPAAGFKTGPMGEVPAGMSGPAGPMMAVAAAAAPGVRTG